MRELDYTRGNAAAASFSPPKESADQRTERPDNDVMPYLLNASKTEAK